MRSIRGVLALAAMLAGSWAWAAEQPRFVMAVSGGASLGVYEAGLAWSLTEVLRREASGAGAPLVAVTGASAGAINALIAAIRYCAEDSLGSGSSRNLFRDTWIDIDLESLLPADGAAYDTLPGYQDGLMTRGALRQSVETLRQRMRQSGFRDGCRVRLGLVVTRNRAATSRVEALDVKTQRFLVPLELEVVAGRLQFRNFTAFPALAETPHLLLLEDALGRVAGETVIRATLASSAFPLAFGRVRLAHCAPSDQFVVGELPAAAETGRCPGGYLPASATFVDGGVFDNLPLGAAMQLGEADEPAAEGRAYQYLYIDPGYRRSATGGDVEQALQAPELTIPETDHYGLLDQTAFLFDALVVAHRNELYTTLRGNDWGGARKILLTTRYAPLAADYLRNFGAFLDPALRRYDYYLGIYDGVLNAAARLCNAAAGGDPDCLPSEAQRLFHTLGLERDPLALVLFGLVGSHEFCAARPCVGRWRWLGGPQQPATADLALRVGQVLLAPREDGGPGYESGTTILAGPEWQAFLRALKPHREAFEAPMRRMIDNPDRWYYTYLRRGTLRLRDLEQAKQDSLDPQEAARNAPFLTLSSLLNLGAHTLAADEQAAGWPVSTAAPGYAWFLPDEVAVDGSQTGTAFTWRGPIEAISGPLYLEWELAPLHWVRDREDRANFAHAAINLRWRRKAYGFSSVGIGAGLYANWRPRDNLDNEGIWTSFNAGLVADKLRVTIGYKTNNQGTDDERLVFTIGINDLKGLLYWF